MKNKKVFILIGALSLLTCLRTETKAVKFYDTYGTRYEGAVERLGELGIINGSSDKTFEANRTITRAEFAKIMVDATLTDEEVYALLTKKEDCPFKDISYDKWYYDYVIAATNYGYIDGYEDGTFRPDDNVTYEQAAKMIMKALGHGYLVETSPRGWSAEYMEKLFYYRIPKGTTGFSKTDSATRGNVAIMIWNMLTNSTWERIYLNEKDGFTYVDSGKVLLYKKKAGYSYNKGMKIDGFSERNNNIHVIINGREYKLYDQDTTVLFSMIGGDAEGIFKFMRYPLSDYRYEVVGLSSDVGLQLYSGTVDELKGDNFKSNVPTVRVGTDADYVYYIKGENEADSRRVLASSKTKNIFVKKFEIKEAKGEEVKDDEDDARKIKSEEHDYEYIEKYTPVTKRIIINENEEIEDGAVLFEDNKRVKWDTVKEGDIITEVQKDRYYFVSHKNVRATIKDYIIDGDDIIFSTSEGELVSYNKAQCLEYYANDGSTIALNKLEKEKIDEFIGLKARFYLDYTGRVARIEILEETSLEKASINLKDLNLGVFKVFNENEKHNMITLFVDGKEKTYRTTLNSITVDYGEFVYFELDEHNVVSSVKKAEKGTKLDAVLKVDSIKYEDAIELNEKIPAYVISYHYDFGVYDKIIGYDVKKTTGKTLKDFKSENVVLYGISNERDTKALFILDYSEKKDLFYGIVERIYTEDSKAKIIINIVGHKKLTFGISGPLSCEEGDFISFKILDKDNVKILEKYRVSSMGYYKDIIVKEVNKENIVAENGEINLKEGKIVTKTDEYIISHFDIILLNLKKDEEDKLYISKGYPVTAKEINLQANDRIAINEIENTIIIYRGY